MLPASLPRVGPGSRKQGDCSKVQLSYWSHVHFEFGVIKFPLLPQDPPCAKCVIKSTPLLRDEIHLGERGLE